MTKILSIEELKNIDFEIVRYSADFVDGKPKIVIHQIRVNHNGKYLKFGKLHEVMHYLSECKTKFKQIAKT